MPLEEFLEKYGYIYNFLGLGDINSKFLAVGFQESFNWKWQDAVKMRSPAEENMISYKQDYFYNSSPDHFNPHSCSYWRNAKRIFNSLGANIQNSWAIFYTEPDPFARPRNSMNISKFYNIISEDKTDLPYKVNQFLWRKSILTEIINRPNKIILVNSFGINKHKQTWIDPMKDLINIVWRNIEPHKNEVLWFHNEFRIWDIILPEGTSIIIECPHLSHNNDEDNQIDNFIRTLPRRVNLNI